MRRDWKQAVRKCEEEGYRCRVCGSAFQVQMAHVIGRSRDEKRGKTAFVNPDSIVPLCKTHHDDYDDHELDLMPYLHIQEQIQAVKDAGGLERARIRLVPSQYRNRKVVAA